MKKIVITLALGLISTIGFSQNLPCPDFVCELDPNATTYSVSNTAGSIYTWTVSGGTIIAGQGTNSIQVDWSAVVPGNYAVEVIETDANGCTGSIVLCDITVNPTPVTGAITHD